MGGYKHTNVATASAATDYARADQAQGSIQWLTSVSGTDTITASATPTPTAYAAGQTFRFIAAATNTGAVTLNVSGLGVKSVTKEGTTALVAGDILSGQVVTVTYDGTQFQLVTPRVSTTPTAATSTNTTRVASTEFVHAVSVTRRAASAGGTADAITVAYTPTVTALVNHMELFVRASAANTTATPTLSVDGLPAKTIVKGNNLPLLAGDIPGAGFHMHVRYDQTLDKFQLMNPAAPVTSLPMSGADILAAIISAGGVAQSHLKTTDGSVSWTGTQGSRTLPGGEYGFWPRLGFTMTIGSNHTYTVSVDVRNNLNGNISAAAYIHATHNWSGTEGRTLTAYQRYVQSSPPYDLGNGDIPVFVFALVDKGSGKIIGSYVAEDPPWANNGPTDIRPDYIDATGRKYKIDRSGVRAALRKALEEGTSAVNIQAQAVEITQALKQADMPIFPHPFPDIDPATQEAVLLDPVGDKAELLHNLLLAGEDISQLLKHIRLGDQLDAIAPPGVVIRRWELT
jgi:hypothetical protein